MAKRKRSSSTSSSSKKSSGKKIDEKQVEKKDLSSLLPIPSTVVDSDEKRLVVPGKTKVSLNLPKEILFDQGQDGITLTTDNPTSLVPESISASKLKQIEDGVKRGQLILGDVFPPPEVDLLVELRQVIHSEDLDVVKMHELTSKIINNIIVYNQDVKSLKQQLDKAKKYRHDEWVNNRRYDVLNQLDVLIRRMETRLRTLEGL